MCECPSAEWTCISSIHTCICVVYTFGWAAPHSEFSSYRSPKLALWRTMTLTRYGRSRFTEHVVDHCLDGESAWLLDSCKRVTFSRRGLLLPVNSVNALQMSVVYCWLAHDLAGTPASKHNMSLSLDHTWNILSKLFWIREYPAQRYKANVCQSTIWCMHDTNDMVFTIVSSFSNNHVFLWKVKLPQIQFHKNFNSWKKRGWV